MLRSLHTPGPKSVVRGQYARGLRRGRGGGGIPRGARRRGRLGDGDVHRRQALRRQLALGGHAVLRPRRQAAAAARDDDRDPVPARAAPAVRRDRRRGAAAERAPDPRSAGRGCLARDRREGARRRHVDPHGAHGLPLRRRLPDEPARGVRASDPRRDARRRDAVHPLGRGRRAVGPRRRDRGGVEARPAELPQLPGRELGTGERGRADQARRPLAGDAIEPERSSPRSRSASGSCACTTPRGRGRA